MYILKITGAEVGVQFDVGLMSQAPTRHSIMRAKQGAHTCGFFGMGHTP